MKTILTLLALLFSFQAFSQKQIKGTVTDKKQEALIGSNVYIKGSYDGTSSDVNGVFSFNTTESGTITLIISSLGYEEQSIEMNLDTLSSNMTVIMKEAFEQLDAVTITAGSFNGSDESKQVVMKPLDIATTAGATADIAGALNTLPGTQKVGETGRLFVRGGEGRETLTFIDGMQVLNSYTPTAPNTPSRNRFSPFMFKGTTFSTGAYSAEYGQALSSALVLNSKDMLGEDRTDIGLMTVGVDIARTQSWEKSSFAGKIQYTNLLPYFSLVNQDIEWVNAPEAASGNFLYRTKTSETGILKLYTSLNRSNLDLIENDPFQPGVKNKVGIANDYIYVNGSYRDILSDKVGIQGGVSFTSNVDEAYRASDKRNDDDKGVHLKTKFDIQLSPKVSLNTGTEVFARKYERTLSNELGAISQNQDEVSSASFLEAETYASKKFVLRSGARLSYNSIAQKASLLPRFSAAYQTGENSQASFGYGQFEQLPEYDLLLDNSKLGAEKATHYIANYQVTKDRKTFRVEAYHKEYQRLAKLGESGFNNNGDGYARGIDVFWRDNDTFNEVDYWISYSYLDTERNYRDFPGSYTPTFASKHNFSFVYKHFISSIKSQIGFTYSFASGRPYNNPNEDGFNQGRTPNYQDLSFNMAYLHRPSIIFYTSISNVLGNQQVFGYEYSNEANMNGVYDRVAITPPASRFIFLGVFITLAKDQTMNQLPNL
ncbi:MAG: TonB-dependent receptor [Bacteroidota bacterium]